MTLSMYTQHVLYIGTHNNIMAISLEYFEIGHS